VEYMTAFLTAESDNTDKIVEGVVECQKTGMIVLPPDINKSKAQFLYREKEKYCFMDMESYEQFSLSEKVLASAKDYLVEGTEMTVLNFNSQPINIELPVKIALRVVEAPPNVRGNTVSSGGKIITLETGLKISAPLFIKEGEKIIVNTERGEYVSRV